MICLQNKYFTHLKLDEKYPWWHFRLNIKGEIMLVGPQVVVKQNKTHTILDVYRYLQTDTDLANIVTIVQVCLR